MENKSISNKLDVTLNPRQGSKHERIDRQNNSFTSFFQLEYARGLPTSRSKVS